MPKARRSAQRSWQWKSTSRVHYNKAGRRVLRAPVRDPAQSRNSAYPNKERKTMSDILQLETHGRVLRLGMNRPEKRNALNSDLCREVVDTVNRANKDPQIGAILIAANGKAFSAAMA